MGIQTQYRVSAVSELLCAFWLLKIEHMDRFLEGYWIERGHIRTMPDSLVGRIALMTFPPETYTRSSCLFIYCAQNGLHGLLGYRHFLQFSIRLKLFCFALQAAHQSIGHAGFAGMLT